MSVTHPTTVRNAAVDMICGLIDAGSGPGKLVFLTSGDVEVATLTFSDPAFGAAEAGVATAGTILADASATGGVIAKASITDSDDNEVFACSVGVAGSGADIILNNTIVAATQEVSITSLTYTGAP